MSPIEFDGVPEVPVRKAMGSRAAYREAVRRWGKDAFTRIHDGGCQVGIKASLLWWTKGWGKTWALAFADADRRAGKP